MNYSGGGCCSSRDYARGGGQGVYGKYLYLLINVAVNLKLHKKNCLLKNVVEPGCEPRQSGLEGKP